MKEINEYVEIPEIENDSEKKEQTFEEECKFIELRYEYTDYKGKEKWAIITALSETELTKKYPEEIRNYCPFVLLSLEQGEAIIEFQNYEAKERMRNLRCGHAFDINDGEFEEHHPEVITEFDYEEMIDKQNDIRRLKSALLKLNERQKSRLIAYFFYDWTYEKIAQIEGVTKQSVEESIKTAIRKLKKFF